MKRFWIVLVSILIAGFLLVTLLKEEDNQNSSSEVIIDEDALQKKEENKIFWFEYRAATKFRIDGEWEKAISRYKKALAINDGHVDAMYYLGNMYLETGKDIEAEGMWKLLIEQNPESSRAHFQLGNLYLNSQNTEIQNIKKAQQEFELTFEINKDFIQPLLALGEISMINGDFVEAQEHFSTVLGSDDKNVAANYFSGYVEWKNGHKSEALDYFNLAIKYSEPELQKEGVSNEGDTKGGKSLERQINTSILESYFSDLSDLPNPVLEHQMDSSYNQLDSFLSSSES